MNRFSALQKGFEGGFIQILQEDRPLQERLDMLTEEEAFELGCRASYAALAPMVWSGWNGLVEERSQVQDSSEVLKVARLALYKRLTTATARFFESFERLTEI